MKGLLVAKNGPRPESAPLIKNKALTFTIYIYHFAIIGMEYQERRILLIKRIWLKINKKNIEKVIIVKKIFWHLVVIITAMIWGFRNKINLRHYTKNEVFH